MVYGFNPLWINTALKLQTEIQNLKDVSIPYGLTLLSNICKSPYVRSIVSIPYGLTLLSNCCQCLIKKDNVSIPYGLTLLSNTSLMMVRVL